MELFFGATKSLSHTVRYSGAYCGVCRPVSRRQSTNGSTAADEISENRSLAPYKSRRGSSTVCAGVSPKATAAHGCLKICVYATRGRRLCMQQRCVQWLQRKESARRGVNQNVPTAITGGNCHLLCGSVRPAPHLLWWTDPPGDHTDHLGCKQDLTRKPWLPGWQRKGCVSVSLGAANTISRRQTNLSYWAFLTEEPDLCFRM